MALWGFGVMHTCCRVCSSVPGGAPPTKSLFSGFGLESPTLGAAPTPETCSMIRGGCAVGLRTPGWRIHLVIILGLVLPW